MQVGRRATANTTPLLRVSLSALLVRYALEPQIFLDLREFSLAYRLADIGSLSALFHTRILVSIDSG